MDKLTLLHDKLKSNNNDVRKVKEILTFQENFIFKYYLNQC